MEFDVLDSEGNIINSIIADIGYMEAFYPNRYCMRVDPNFLISKSGFINRFSVEEWQAISTSTDAIVVAVFNAIQDVSEQINLKQSFAKNILQVLVNKNLLTTERMNAILETPVEFLEKM